MRIQPTQEYLTDVRRLWEVAETNRERKAIIDKAATEFGLAYCTMTRKLNLNARKRSLSPKQQERSAELESYTRRVYDFKASAEYDTNYFTVSQTYDLLVEAGQIPTGYTLSSIRRKAREIGLPNEYRSPYRKFIGRSTALHLVMIDYSKSRYFHYKNDGQIYMAKHMDATKEEEPRLYFVCAVDWYSRVCYFKYYMSKGESKEFVRDAMLDVFCEKIDYSTGEIGRKLLQGIPKQLYFDRGKGNVAKETVTGLLKLRVERIIGSVEIDAKGRRTNRSNKKARGLVERFIRDFKERFETHLWGKQRLGLLEPDMTLFQLNELAEQFTSETNSRPHPVLKDQIRWEMFAPVLETVTYPPKNAKLFFGGWQPRKVQRRLIQGETREDWFIAPEFINDRETVDILLIGKEGYLFYENDLVKLQPQLGSFRDVIESESGEERYSDFLLRNRLAKEIELQSGGSISIRSLAESLSDDLTEFEERPRSVTEIKEKANYFITVTRRQSNIITYTKIIPLRNGEL